MAVPPTTRYDQRLLLPEDAPRIRVTAGPGTASQKTWYLRRPVTLIGSHRSAFIVLRNEVVAPVHCAIVNTGSMVLLKDLHTSSGTLRDDSPIDRVVLEDGDLLEVGGTLIQVAIQTLRKPVRHADADERPADPWRLPQTVWLRGAGGSPVCRLQDNCATVGSGDGVDVRLDCAGVRPLHALAFALNGRAALFKLDPDGAMRLNGLPVELAQIGPGDLLDIGECRLEVSAHQVRLEGDGSAEPGPDTHATCSSDEAAEDAHAAPPAHGDPSLDETRRRLIALQEDITTSWSRVNDWQGSERSCMALGGVEWRQDEQDAVLRGRLHDLTAYQEELAAREQELRARCEALERDRQRLEEETRALQEREAAFLGRQERLAPPRSAIGDGH